MIAVAMAVFRPHPHYLLEQLQSLRAQTREDWICVLNWDSPISEIEGTEAQALLAADRRFICVQNSDRLGPKKNFESAIRAAASLDVTAIACADQDDVWLSGKLEVLMQALELHPRLSLVHSDMEAFYSSIPDGLPASTVNSVWGLERRNVAHSRPEHLLMRNIVTGCSMVMDVNLARRYPEIPDSFPMHDHWYALAATHHGGVYPVQVMLVRYRQHTNNLIGARPPEPLLDRLTKVGVKGLYRNALTAYSECRKRTSEAKASGFPEIPQIKKLFGSEPSIAVAIDFVALGLRIMRDDSFLAREAFKLAVGCLGSRRRGKREGGGPEQLAT
jgi:hypothetical protein